MGYTVDEIPPPPPPKESVVSCPVYDVNEWDYTVMCRLCDAIDLKCFVNKIYIFVIYEEQCICLCIYYILDNKECKKWFGGTLLSEN